MTAQNNQVKAKEIWVPCKYIDLDGTIEEYPGYEVSNLGKVKSLNYNHTGKSKVIKPGAKATSHGTYYQVTLCKGKKSHWVRVHRLVLSSFNPKGYFKDAVCDHIDSNPSNNRLSNLRWVTQQENISTSHCKALLTNHPSFSKRVKVTFLDDGHYEIFPSTHEVVRTLGIPHNTIYDRVLNRNGLYKKLNLLFEYV